MVKELVYAYAMWISAAFQLKVIRAFDTLQTQGVAVADHAAEDLLKNPLKYVEAIQNTILYNLHDTRYQVSY